MNLGRRSGGDVVGLDIQPGFVAAVQARVNGSILAERAVTLPLGPETMRDGEVADELALSDSLRELFDGSGLSKRVRVGVANQRTVLRTLELPPLTDHKELAAAVQFQAQDQVPMPLDNAVMDFQPLGIIDTPAGPRQVVILVAAQRDMVERLLAAVRGAGLTADGVDLSAFALIRSLYRHDPEQTGRVLYLNVDGLTNLAIAEGKICRFTRVVGSGLEGMAGELAVRRGIALTEARELLGDVDLEAVRDADIAQEAPVEAESPVSQADPEAQPQTVEEQETAERAMRYEEEMAAIAAEPAPNVAAGADSDIFEVLETGIREISGEVRNSLDFHRSQDGGGEVSSVVLSGSAQDIPGFAKALELSLGLQVHSASVGLVDEHLADTVATHRLAVATGLATSEVAQ
jgi:type IV pilus assembly protein PilM